MNHDDVLAVLSTAAVWRKSTRSEGQNGCVEVTNAVPGWIGVRDSTLGPTSPILAFTATEWTALLATAKDGELDL